MMIYTLINGDLYVDYIMVINGDLMMVNDD